MLVSIMVQQLISELNEILAHDQGHGRRNLGASLMISSRFYQAQFRNNCFIERDPHGIVQILSTRIKDGFLFGLGAKVTYFIFEVFILHINVSSFVSPRLSNFMIRLV